MAIRSFVTPKITRNTIDRLNNRAKERFYVIRFILYSFITYASYYVAYVNALQNSVLHYKTLIHISVIFL